MNEKSLEDLRQFFGAYFHQDWPDDARVPDEIVGRFLSDEPDSSRRTYLADLMEEFAARAESDEALEKALFRDLWCYYTPSSEGFRAGDWVRQVAAVLRGG
jgi:hypothetical protein